MPVRKPFDYYSQPTRKFVQLDDAPTSIEALYLLRGNAAGNALEFVNPATLYSGTYVANAGDTMTGKLSINSSANTQSLHLTPTGDAGNSTSTGGAILLNNTSNNGAGIVLYTNNGASATGRAMNIRVDNAAFPNAAFHVDYDGTANAVEIVNNGTDSSSQALNVVSSNPNDSTMGVNGEETGKGTIKIVHTGTGTDANASGISIDLQGPGTAAQGLYIDSTASGGTTGKLLRLRNQSVDMFTVEYNGVIKVSNPAATFLYSITPAAIGANRTLNLPLITGTDTLATLGLAQTFSADQTFQNILTSTSNTYSIGSSSSLFRFIYAKGGEQIGANEYAFQISPTTNSGMYFDNVAPKNISLNISGTKKHAFYMGASAQEGVFYHLPRTGDPTGTAVPAGSMYVKDDGAGNYTLMIFTGGAWAAV